MTAPEASQRNIISQGETTKGLVEEVNANRMWFRDLSLAIRRKRSLRAKCIASITKRRIETTKQGTIASINGGMEQVSTRGKRATMQKYGEERKSTNSRGWRITTCNTRTVTSNSPYQAPLAGGTGHQNWKPKSKGNDPWWPCRLSAGRIYRASTKGGGCT